MDASHDGSPDLTDEDALRLRVCAATESISRGNLKAAAKALGVGYGTVLRVVRDGQSPSSRLLLALVDRARVDPSWLMTGTLHPPDGPRPEAVLLDELIPGPLSQTPVPRGATRATLVARDLAEGVYAYQVPREHPITRVPWPKVKAGDVLFIDSLTTLIDREWLSGPLLVVWRWSDPGGGRPRTALGDVGVDGRGVGRIYDAAVRRFPFRCVADGSKADKTTKYPPDPAKSGVLHARHVAGVCIGQTRRTSRFFEI